MLTRLVTLSNKARAQYRKEFGRKSDEVFNKRLAFFAFEFFVMLDINTVIDEFKVLNAKEYYTEYWKNKREAAKEESEEEEKADSAERRSAERRSKEDESVDSAERSYRARSRSSERRSAERQSAERRSKERRSAERRSAERRSAERRSSAPAFSSFQEHEDFHRKKRCLSEGHSDCEPGKKFSKSCKCMKTK